MAKIGRPKAEVVLTESERTRVDSLDEAGPRQSGGRVSRPRGAGVRRRPRQAVVRRLRTTKSTVAKWRTPVHRPPTGGVVRRAAGRRAADVSDDAVEAVIVKTLETTPKGETHWSTRTMAAKAGHESHDGRPHLAHVRAANRTSRESFKLSPDPQLVAKMRDVVGLYMHPPHNAVVFAVDEKSQIQALQRAQPILPMDIGQPERRTHNYLRHGTVDLFAALNVATGEVLARCKPQHRAQDFVAFLRDIDGSVEAEREVHVVLDNLSAHKAPAVHRWLLRHPRFQFHFTPTYASWLNLVERFFGLLTEKALKRGSHTSIPQLRDAILAYVEAHNETRQALQVDQDRRRDPRQDAAIRTPRAAGAWTMTGLFLEITDPGD